ncbi:hypothetical protein LEP1GSC034_0897 [Leptospira interrogans str. 2003000735]|uniref:Uncharacterized protein n=3 Tax=Leptospira interrogans TaxID=173 RepID=A0A829D4L5_LEPIR|nr:hypothetical protein [Leptospira interrogans]EMY03905.1 hypothetical protein LEP1GSC029_3789 [Leptospira interrogans str. 2002000626]EMY26789.1 hypothetical protein LEP1GSC115_4512 [Leptospira interrogans serovar Australis str. 200703203]EKN86865.1 hypothetical protein LEP1GSC027_2483 [Leptospira interrogans str. 2002000624]EKQ36987.1 hypothetical protein LEP1GSC025_1400 [Leptospira interrogans str. 2002000621]EKQ46651.1 hypothetical protein LEP1GSC026_1117 [Leptospira interrogans str. 2002
MFEKRNKSILKVILIIFGFFFTISIQTQEPYVLDVPCREFGNYTNLKEIEKAKVKNDSTKILVKTINGSIKIPIGYVNDAKEITDENSFRIFIKTYESICGKGSKPAIYNSIQFVASGVLANCIKKFEKTFQTIQARSHAVNICHDTLNATLNNSIPLKPLDPRCPDFGTLTLKKEELDNVRLNEPFPVPRIWVRAHNGENIAVQENLITNALGVSNDEELLFFLVNYSMVCGRKVPPFFESIPYVESQAFKFCVWKLKTMNDPQAESKCYEKHNDLNRGK